MKVIEVEKIVEILSDIRAQYNCFDIDEAACYHVMSDAIARVNKSSFIELKRGEWISKHNGYWTCSECGLSFLFYAKGNFCPNCGADMRKESE